MAIGATCVWEVRATATAGNLNGGGFVPGGGGTDYSQQDAAQFNGTDLAGENANTGTPDVSAASHSFVAADVGNMIHITAGSNWTPGWYEIKSVSAGKARLDRACASVASPSGGTWYEGGAISLQDASDSTWAAVPVAGNVIYIKNGSYTLGAGVTLAPSGSSGSGCKVIGYNTTRGDDPATLATRPTLVGSATCSFGNYCLVENLNLSNNVAAGWSLGTYSRITNCKIINISTTASRVALTVGANSHVDGCEVISYRGSAISLGANSATVMNCFVHSSNIGIASAASATTTHTAIIGCVIESCVAQAINFSAANSGGTLILNNTLYGTENKRGTGINFANTAAQNIRIINNIIYGFATGVSHGDGTVASFLDKYNCYYNNTADVSGWAVGDTSTTNVAPVFAQVSQIAGTAATTNGSVLTDASKDFSSVVDNVDYLYLVSGTGITAGFYKITAHTATTVTLDIAPGTSATADKVYNITRGHDFRVSAAMKGAGFPQVYPGGLFVSSMDIGGVQRTETESASSTKRLGQARMG